MARNPRKTTREIWDAYWKKKWEEEKKARRKPAYTQGYYYIGK